MKQFILTILLVCTYAFSIAQELTFTVSTNNPSALNSDCEASVINIKGGKAPYTYKWSKQDIPLDSAKATGLSESTKYTITVTDATGLSSTQKFKVAPIALSEKVNKIFGIMVDGVAAFLMADIFATLHIYDPVIYDENGNALLHPNGDPKTNKIPLIVVWLFLGALYFTFKFKFINFRGFKHAIHLIQGKFDKPGEQGQISHFQALTTALSATVGLGNIAGVAFAIGIGGPGATFWMILMGLIGMASKFTEATLGVKYRRMDKRGDVSGGPMYYLRYAFGTKGFGKKIGNTLAGIFAVLLIGSSLGGGNMFQANQSFLNLQKMIPGLDDFGPWFGLILAILVGTVIIGGITKIARVTSKVVPIMAGIYIITALYIIGANISHVDDVAVLIFKGAFSAKSLYGGFIGVLVMGVQRACFSNEAGIGSAAIAHSAVKTNEPISEGIVALLEPFIDTVVICSMTAFILLFTGYASPEYTSQFSGAALTSEAFSSVIPWFDWILLIAIILFAFSTLISWSYYGLKGFDYLFGNFAEKRFGSRNVSDLAYKLIFLSFTIIGASSSAGNVLDFSDMMLLSMAFPNIIGLVIFAPRIKRDLDKYWQKIRSGQIKRYR